MKVYIKEIVVIEERIAQRSEVLKGRAVSFQQNGGQVSYIEVILGSTSFGDFIDRVGAVATIVEADQNILSEQEADKKAVEEKQKLVEEKLTNLNNTMVELEGMQAQITEQKAENETLKKQLTQQENESSSEIASLQAREAELAAQKADLLAAAQFLKQLFLIHQLLLILQNQIQSVSNSSTSTKTTTEMNAKEANPVKYKHRVR